MSHPDRVRPNDEEVASSVVDGEAIFINLSTGVYYSLRGAGAALWSLLAAGHSVDAAAQRIAAIASVSAAEVARDGVALIARLLEERLVLPAEHGAAEPAEVELDAQWIVPYATPTLETYSDMADLLALDPPMPGLGGVPWADKAR
jgi:hypothetical protein